MLAKARTGTGKTVAFLLPTIERLAKDQQKTSRGVSPIRALVISPTRELAQQISVEADQLMKHHRSLRAGCVVGGTKVSQDIRMMKGSLDLLVATPGRLEDHMKNTAGFAERLGGVQTLVLDEGQQLYSVALTSSHTDTELALLTTTLGGWVYFSLVPEYTFLLSTATLTTTFCSARAHTKSFDLLVAVSFLIGLVGLR